MYDVFDLVEGQWKLRETMKAKSRRQLMKTLRDKGKVREGTVKVRKAD